jgi:hypothetical protein
MRRTVEGGEIEELDRQVRPGVDPPHGREIEQKARREHHHVGVVAGELQEFGISEPPRR